MLSSLYDIQPLLEKLSVLLPELAESASEERSRELQTELDNVKDRLETLTGNLTEKTKELTDQRDDWVEFYGSCDQFGNWLGDKQGALQQLRLSNLPPDQQFTEAKVVCSDIFDNHTVMENIEDQCQQLTAGLRSRETTAAKTKVGN